MHESTHLCAMDPYLGDFQQQLVTILRDDGKARRVHLSNKDPTSLPHTGHTRHFGSSWLKKRVRPTQRPYPLLHLAHTSATPPPTSQRTSPTLRPHLPTSPTPATAPPNTSRAVDTGARVICQASPMHQSAEQSLPNHRA